MLVGRWREEGPGIEFSRLAAANMLNSAVNLLCHSKCHNSNDNTICLCCSCHQTLWILRPCTMRLDEKQGAPDGPRGTSLDRCSDQGQHRVQVVTCACICMLCWCASVQGEPARSVAFLGHRVTFRR